MSNGNAPEKHEPDEVSPENPGQLTEVQIAAEAAALLLLKPDQANTPGTSLEEEES